MISTYIILALLWIAYGFIHSFFAVPSVKAGILKALNTSESSYRIAYNLFAFGSLAGIIFFQSGITNNSIYIENLTTEIISMVLIIVGTTVMIICIVKYFKQLSGIEAEAKSKKLEVTGIHKFVRHPLYLGTFLFLIGLFLWFPYVSNLITVSVIIIYTLIGIHFEERKLVQKFGNEYIL